MEPSLDARLKSIEEKLDKNNQLLVKVRRVQRQGQLFKILYWVLIVLLAFGAFYYIQPYVNQLLETYTGIQDTQEKMQSTIPNLTNINELINQLKGN
jgi:cell division protein FtsL